NGSGNGLRDEQFTRSYPLPTGEGARRAGEGTGGARRRALGVVPSPPTPLPRPLFLAPQSRAIHGPSPRPRAGSKLGSACSGDGFHPREALRDVAAGEVRHPAVLVGEQ